MEMLTDNFSKYYRPPYWENCTLQL